MTRTPADQQNAVGPGQLREQVEQTRQEFGHTVQAFAGKIDVKTRVRQKTRRAEGPGRLSKPVD
ncbi:DUF3618 domain-containing protein [Streptomyces sp. NPDC056738]|uniref:DUF3618 domain-containing protein n=1 Tax=Streptomyces sp. NPDC056738 TaxID=3345933 RepID=UPI0036A68E1D